ncbi:MAG: hypothetical protein JXB05_27685 [Myxococcaceae bacterium]|nr:hypothetical protein [Myxococcaceae bacterium]
MAQKRDVARIQDELIDAFKWNEEERARALVFQLGDHPDEVRAVLESMLKDSFGLARQAAVFGLGELGGPASVSRLAQQFAVEEARGDYDGEAVVEDIISALGRIDEDSARTRLVRILEHWVLRRVEPSEFNVLAYSLWRRRHPELIPVVRSSIERLALPAPHLLHGLLALLERAPEELSAWVLDPSVPVELKTKVLVLLEKDIPDSLRSTLPACVAATQVLGAETMSGDSAVADYCERLFILLLADRERLLGSLPREACTTLRAVARRLIVATFPNPSLWAAVVLQHVGRSEDAAFLDKYRPVDPTCAKVFIDAAQALRSLH